jgi:predicted TIM-barrel fold metal-dependent hydrolase
LLARHDQLLELMLYPYQAEEVARLALDFPDQTFIVNHCGSPIDRDRNGIARWKDGLTRLGSAPNVLIKISALTAYDPSPTPESLREVALHCVECFGVDRSMFGSDFPVGRLWTSYDEIFDGFKAIVRDFSEAEQAALFYDNARRVYRMDAL